MTKPGRQKWQHELLHGVCFVTDSWAETKVCRPSLACQTWKEWLKTTSTHSDLSKSSKQTFLLSVNLHPLELGSKELHTQKRARRNIDFTRSLPPLAPSLSVQARATRAGRTTRPSRIVPRGSGLHQETKDLFNKKYGSMESLGIGRTSKHAGGL